MKIEVILTEIINIYLAGGMCKFGKEKFNMSNEWRIFVKQYLENNVTDIKVNCINPNNYFSFADKEPLFESQREVMEFDLNKVRNSDLIIINFNDKYSLGSMAELAIAYERRTPVIGLNIENQELHPWQIEMTNRIFNDINKMLEYIKEFYMT